MSETMVNAICYRERKTGKEFLAYISWRALEGATAEAEEINRTRPEKLCTGDPALCDEREYFVNVQRSFF